MVWSIFRDFSGSNGIFWDLMGFYGISLNFSRLDAIIVQFPPMLTGFKPFQADGLEHFQGFLRIEWDFLGSDGIFLGSGGI